MGYRARLRLELLDRPGTLAAATAVLAELGANVIGVDVQEVAGDTVVDEVAVELPDDLDEGELRRALHSAGAGVLVSAQPARPYGDVVLRALQWAELLATTHPDDRNDVVGQAAADLCSAAGAWVVSPAGDARRWEAGRLALERGTAVVHRARDLPVALAPDLPGEALLLAVPDDDVDPARVAFLARPLGLRFTAAEIGRVSALLRTCRCMSAPAEAPGLAVH